jgi:hypothetical protein
MMDSHKLTSKGTHTPQGSVKHQQNQCYSSLLGRVQVLTALQAKLSRTTGIS